jgi:hypothetical protein
VKDLLYLPFNTGAKRRSTNPICLEAKSLKKQQRATRRPRAGEKQILCG